MPRQQKEKNLPMKTRTFSFQEIATIVISDNNAICQRIKNNEVNTEKTPKDKTEYRLDEIQTYNKLKTYR